MLGRLLPHYATKGSSSYSFLSQSPPPISEYSPPPAPPTRLPSKRALLVTLWLYTSPFILLIVLAYSYHTRSNVGGPLKLPVVFNPYALRPRPLDLETSLEHACQHGTSLLGEGKKPLFSLEESIANLDLPIDRHLTNAQCDGIFPGLYREADRARDYYAARGGVSLDDLDEAQELGQARAQIVKNRLYVKFFSNSQQGTRTMATLAAINEALITSLEPLPDVEFVLQTGDTGVVKGAPWVLGRSEDQESLVLMPDYGFNSWPEPGVGSFLEVQDKTLLYESHLRWEDKIPKLFWRGALMVDIRKEFTEIASKYPWGAVGSIDWLNRTAVQETVLTPEEHCQYKFLGHVEGGHWIGEGFGGGAYSGRLKYLQQCRSVVIAHKLNFIQHYHHLFNPDPNSPDQNIVILPGRNFDELPTVMKNLLDDEELSERIANNSFTFYRHWLSPASTNCYWRRLIHRWAEVQSFQPELLSATVSFSSFSLLGKTHWDPY